MPVIAPIGQFEYPRFPTPRPQVDEPRHRVLIAGGGPVGLSLALALAKNGIASVIIEQDTTVCIGSRAACISRRSLEILDRLGAVEAFLETGLAWRYGRSFYRGETVMSFDMGHDEQQKFPPMINLQQYYIESFLAEAATRHPQLIDIRWGHRINAVEEDEHNVKLTLESEHGTSSIEGDWLVACDGGRSFIRQALDLPMQGHAHQDRYVIIDIELDSQTPPERRVWFETGLRKGPVWMHRQPDNIWRIDYRLEDHISDTDGMREENVLPVVQQLLDMIGETGQWRPIWISLYSAKALSLENYRHRRVLFAGDAAHLVPIFGVRGLNGGFDDAFNLGWKLAAVVRKKASLALLDSYSVERRGGWADNALAASRSAEFMGPSSPGGETLRDAVLSLAAKHPSLSSLINPRQTHSITYRQSPLNSQEPQAHEFPPTAPQLGAILGNACVQVQGSKMYLSDLLEHNFMLLRIAPVNGVLPPAPVCHDPLSTTGALRTLDIGRPGQPLANGLITVEDSTGLLSTRYATANGALYLVRPDGHVCWRKDDSRSTPDRELQQALEHASQSAEKKHGEYQ